MVGGSIFAVLQSLGATGACFGAVKTGLAVCGLSTVWKVFENWFAQDKDEEEQEEE